MRHPPERRNIFNIGHCARFVDHRRRKSQQDACWLAHRIPHSTGRGCETVVVAASMSSQCPASAWGAGNKKQRFAGVFCETVAQ
ncbi:MULTISPECIES: hypothetical protein [unclassified Comamonas]|uniref:Uncharacterized protein n=1 Tax=Comamonas squillarum TaxID=2977320 RepID=A0ABY6A0D8_9BURK|nr:MULTISPECIES: hypothetical protein [unclassified Comamonas]UXC18390.1 hypothetical protein N4T19_22365 [Comamonas sp. PR12]